MKHNHSNDPAFPVLEEINCKEVVGSHGLTVREYYAAQALVGLLSSGGHDEYDRPKIASLCFQYADAMIEQDRK